jgi:hypothetical protein
MAKTWEVAINEEVIHFVEVEADTKEEAYNKAYRIISEGTDSEYRTEAEGYTGAWNAEELD